MITLSDAFNRIENEIWKVIPNCDGYHFVSNMGRVKSVDYFIKSKYNFKIIKGKIFKGNVKKTGYKVVRLTIDGKDSDYRIHQLVAMCFLDYKRGDNKISVNHINGIKNDNILINLEVITQKENIRKHYESERNTVRSSKYLNVSWNKQAKNWKSLISINNKSIYLGFFHNEIDCANHSLKATNNVDKYNGNAKEFREYLNSI